MTAFFPHSLERVNARWWLDPVL